MGLQNCEFSSVNLYLYSGPEVHNKENPSTRYSLHKGSAFHDSKIQAFHTYAWHEYSYPLYVQLLLYIFLLLRQDCPLEPIACLHHSPKLPHIIFSLISNMLFKMQIFTVFRNIYVPAFFVKAIRPNIHVLPEAIVHAIRGNHIREVPHTHLTFLSKRILWQKELV